MNLYDYFENTKGLGVLSTADGNGKVNSAVYARPHVMEDGKFAFIMRDRLSHENLKSNPGAAYLFVEDGDGYKGKRFHLSMVREEENPEKIAELRRRKYETEEESKYLVYFQVDEELPLISGKKG